jgi:hypothetical protein
VRIGGAAAPEPTTKLGEIDGFLAWLRAAGELRPRSVEFYEHKAKGVEAAPWCSVSALRREQGRLASIYRSGLAHMARADSNRRMRHLSRLLDLPDLLPSLRFSPDHSSRAIGRPSRTTP